jgi:hypothetical protein
MLVPLHSYSSAARELGITRQAVADVARCMNITPKPCPMSGIAKGLDEADMRVLRRTLRLPEPEEE